MIATEKPPTGAAALAVKVTVDTFPAESKSAVGLAATDTVGVGGAVKFNVYVLATPGRATGPEASSAIHRFVLALNEGAVVTATFPSSPEAEDGHAFPKLTQLSVI